MQRGTLGLRTRGFRAFLATQFLGALNDNAFKYLLISMIVFRAVGDPTLASRQTSLAQGLFALPFVIFAAWAGVVADRWGKTAIFVVAKAVEACLKSSWKNEDCCKESETKKAGY